MVDFKQNILQASASHGGYFLTPLSDGDGHCCKVKFLKHTLYMLVQCTVYSQEMKSRRGAAKYFTRQEFQTYQPN